MANFTGGAHACDKAAQMASRCYYSTRFDLQPDPKKSRLCTERSEPFESGTPSTPCTSCDSEKVERFHGSNRIDELRAMLQAKVVRTSRKHLNTGRLYDPHTGRAQCTLLLIERYHFESIEAVRP